MQETNKPVSTPEPVWIRSARTVIKRKQYGRINIHTGHLVPNGRNRRGGVVLMDMFSASALTQVWDALSNEARAKFGSMNVVAAIALAFKVIHSVDKSMNAGKL